MKLMAVCGNEVGRGCLPGAKHHALQPQDPKIHQISLVRSEKLTVLGKLFLPPPPHLPPLLATDSTYHETGSSSPCGTSAAAKLSPGGKEP